MFRPGVRAAGAFSFHPIAMEKIMNAEAIALLIAGAVKPLAIDKAAEIGAKVGDIINDKIEGTKSQLDDEGKEVLKAFLDGLRPELDVEGVDTEEPAPTE